MAGAVHCQLQATLQQAMSNEEAQGRVTSREQAFTDSFPEHHLRPLTFQACGLPEPPLVPSHWTAFDGFRDLLKKLLEEKSLGQSIMQQEIPQLSNFMWTKIFCCLFILAFDSSMVLSNFSTFWITRLLLVMLDPNGWQKIFLISLYRMISFIWTQKLHIKTRSGIISFWKAHGCPNVPNHLPSSRSYFSYYNDFLSLTVENFIFVSWGS